MLQKECRWQFPVTLCEMARLRGRANMTGRVGDNSIHQESGYRWLFPEIQFLGEQQVGSRQDFETI